VAQRASPCEALVRQATRYVGYPYLLAGVSPATGFDCSGFTWYIVHETLGADIGRSVGEQWSAGRVIPGDSLQPGDLVFFADTWGPGLTHVGIYIGSGQFIHAENEMTGVVISDLGGDYYASHYAGAVRIA
jgi:cell wall-associated NlpC family hydrolase